MTDTELLELILTRLDKIEEMLEKGIQNNKTLEIKETRQLMQDIVKYYKETEPIVNVEIGTTLHIFRFRYTIAKIKNIKNTKFEQRRLMKWIRKLEEYQFVKKINGDQFEVLDTGKPWEDL